MRICAFSDIHESYNFLKKISSYLENSKPDLILFAGDFLNSGSSQEYTIDFLDILEGTKIPTLAVTGNADDEDTALILEKKGISLENRTIEIDGEKFSGFSPDATKPFTKGFDIAGSIAMSHHPISMPSKKLAGSPKIWIAGHLHRYWVESKFNTLYVHLPAANNMKVVSVDSSTSKCRIINIS